ncbi:unnamed protein product [Allacma fusca]|uniref:CHK kinase-like domain-containing protein n=1 Tax=Allacma fusca TaxID=39272 RepID=A0A8J2P685_9HEXA|nr:unnamed protein product [Allacma fusca]
MATICTDSESLDKYGEILIKNGITSEIKEIQTILPDLVGDHFSSRCECLSVYFKDSTLTPLELFVKKTVTNYGYALLLNDMELFQTEKEFFNTVVIAMKELMKQKNGLDLESSLPKCYYADKELVVMENLVKNGYFVLDKTNGHTFEQSRIALRSLAKLHGISYVLVNQLGEEAFLEKYPFLREARMWSPKGAPVNAPYLQSIIDATIKILQKHPTTGSDKMLEQVLQYEKDAFFKLSRYFNLKNPSCAKVICHGDLWNPNLLFKGSDKTKELEECVIIDFQTVHLGSPASDLVRYLFLAVDVTVRRHDWKTLLEVYYEYFKETVEKLEGVTKFSLKDLINDFVENVEPGYYFGLFSAFETSGGEGVPDIENIEGDVMDTLTSTFHKAIEDTLKEKGNDYSVILVEAFHEFQKLSDQRN